MQLSQNDPIQVTRKVTFRLPRDIDAKIKLLAQFLGRTESQIVEEAIKEYVSTQTSVKLDQIGRNSQVVLSDQEALGLAEEGLRLVRGQ